MKILHLSIIAFVAAGIMILTLSFPVAFANGVSTMGGPPMGPQFLLTQVIASGNDVYLLWQHGGTLFFQRSIDGGAIFEKPIGVLTGKGITSVDPQMSVSGNTVYLTANYVDNGTSYLVFKRSIDNGTSFGNVTTLDIRQHSLGFLTLDLVSSGDNVYLAWDENGGDIFLKKSNDDGVTFGDAVNISNGTKSFGDPKIAVSNNHVYIVMEGGCKINTVNEQICYPAPFVRTSNDYGKTFGKITFIINGTESAFSTDAQISTEGDHVYIIWQYNGYNVGKILFAKSDDAGATFGKTIYFE
ncbi:MAG: sialidase family protein, partial [Nitrosotalea sp.]